MSFGHQTKLRWNSGSTIFRLSISDSSWSMSQGFVLNVLTDPLSPLREDEKCGLVALYDGRASLGIHAADHSAPSRSEYSLNGCGVPASPPVASGRLSGPLPPLAQARRPYPRASHRRVLAVLAFLALGPSGST